MTGSVTQDTQRGETWGEIMSRKAFNAAATITTTGAISTVFLAFAEADPESSTQHESTEDWKRLLVPCLSIIAYFAITLPCILLCVVRGIKPLTLHGICQTLLGVFSLSTAWFYIFTWMIKDLYGSWAAQNTSSSSASPTWVDWLVDVDLFDAAYVLVVEDAAGWWWSSQLLLTTVSVVLFYWAEGPHRVVYVDNSDVGSPSREGETMVGFAGAPFTPRKLVESTPPSPASSVRQGRRKRKVRAWFISAYVYLVAGFFGAMSTSFALFLAQRSSVTGPYVIEPSGNPSLPSCILLALSVVSVVITPYIPPTSWFFGFNLKALHAYLFIPIVVATGWAITKRPKDSTQRQRQQKDERQSPKSRPHIMYAFLAGCSLVSHVFLTSQQVMPFFTTPSKLSFSLSSSGYQWVAATVLPVLPPPVVQNFDVITKLVPPQVWSTVFQVIDGTGFVVGHLYSAMWSNRCQTSISFDLVFITLAFMVFVAMETIFSGPSKGKQVGLGSKGLVAGLMWLAATPVLSVSVALPLFLIWKDSFAAERR
ncbi:hypothetical protein HK102_004032 [Quaeritorhiza haematococci]|nr:hypothetical protein HK102_004032 [Quaeritorhiza haematococci]